MGSDQLFKKKKFRKIEELARKEAKKDPYEIITIVCEDSKSTPNYFREMIKHLRLNTANVKVVPSKGSAPISVVNYGIEITKKDSSVDRVYCVMDYDNHESLKRAINKLNDHNLKKNENNDLPIFESIISTPCFELWLLFHFKYSTKVYYPTGKKTAADTLIAELQELLPSYEKNSARWFSSLIDKLNTAIKNAKKLQKHNSTTDSINPATNVHELIEYLMNFKKQL